MSEDIDDKIDDIKDDIEDLAEEVKEDEIQEAINEATEDAKEALERQQRATKDVLEAAMQSALGQQIEECKREIDKCRKENQALRARLEIMETEILNKMLSALTPSQSIPPTSEPSPEMTITEKETEISVPMEEEPASAEAMQDAPEVVRKRRIGIV